jgi:hypothetical protein
VTYFARVVTVSLGNNKLIGCSRAEKQRIYNIES